MIRTILIEEARWSMGTVSAQEFVDRVLARCPIGLAVQALETIKRDEGKVCDQYEMCEHRACQSSYSAWAIADAALRRLQEGAERVNPYIAKGAGDEGFD